MNPLSEVLIAWVIIQVFLLSCGKKDAPALQNCHMETLSQTTYKLDPWKLAMCPQADEVMESCQLTEFMNGQLKNQEVTCKRVEIKCQ